MILCSREEVGYRSSNCFRRPRSLSEATPNVLTREVGFQKQETNVGSLRYLRREASCCGSRSAQVLIVKSDPATRQDSVLSYGAHLESDNR